MCGILGGINFDIDQYTDAKKLLHHRGPDENGDFRDQNLYLYHARLGIQDIKSGQQPLIADGFVIIFNGEIYNHKTLRTAYNLKCRTNSDTETLLKLYQILGPKMLDLLDGMFVFAIYNTSDKTLFFARDRAGEKPLYIYRKDNRVAFASELNALRSVTNPELNLENFNQFLRYCFVGSSTPYKNIFELPAASWYRINVSTLAFEQARWWSIDEFYKQKSQLGIVETIEKVDNLLHQSVQARLENSDLEVGTFLSGGIDSGLVTAIASSYKKDLKTFTVAFSGQYDESHLAEQVAKKYGTNHTKIDISFSNLKNDLERILTNYGEPYADSSAIPSYYVSKEAKKYLTVVLNGDGADELFGGYRRYVPFLHYDFFENQRFKDLFHGISSKLPYPKDKKTKYNYIYRLIDFAGKEPLQAYLSATVDSFEGYEKFFYSKENPFSEIEQNLNSLSFDKISGLRKIMCLDFNFLFANDLLVKMDIATMANSLEGRTPFLSKEILEFAPTINDEFKINKIRTKHILRELSKKYLPKELVNQPKRGFEVPLRNWIENDLSEITKDYLSGSTFAETFIEKQFISKLIEDKVKVSSEKRAKMLWIMLTLEIWYRKCYSKN